MQHEPSVGVVVPVHNQLPQTLRFLKSIRAVAYRNYKLIVVDDGSTDGTAEALARLHPDVVRLPGNGNLWWSGATNLGVRYAIAAGHDYVLTINNDTEVRPDFLACLVQTARANPRSIVGARINFLDQPRKIWSVGGYLNWGGGEALQLHGHGGLEDEVLANRTNPFPVDLLTGCGTLVPTACYREVGLYDERWCPQYHGDSEFVLRAGQHGWRSLVDLRAVVFNDVHNTCTNRNPFSRHSPWFWRPLFAIHGRYCPPRYVLTSLAHYYGLTFWRAPLRRAREWASRLARGIKRRCLSFIQREERQPVLPAAEAPGNLWVDVTTLLHWKGKHTGIPRTMACIVKEWLREEGHPLRLCRFDDSRGVFVELARAMVDGVIRQSQTAPAAGTDGKAPTRRRSWGVRRALECLLILVPNSLHSSSRTFVHAIWHLVRMTRFLLRDLFRYAATTMRSIALRAMSLLGRRATRPLFQKGDVLFSPGGSWDWPKYLEIVGRHKRETGVEFVPLVYDLIPARMPQFFPVNFPDTFRRWLVDLLWLSDRVVTISENSRRDLADFAAEHRTRLPPVDVIRLGDVVETAGPPQRPAKLSELGTERPFVLSVGTIEVRKNHHLLYQVWRRLIAEHGDAVPTLVLAGQPGWLCDDLLHCLKSDPVVRDRVILLCGATDAELAWLFQNCLFTVYPSHYEGWGLPVAEALTHGKYCIASGTSSLPEIAGDLVSYHDPLDFVGFKRLVSLALFDETYRARREEMIRTCYRATPWSECARSLLSILRCHGTGDPRDLASRAA